jgi:NAD(P)-dependent dehydrogenase (short-subunit alcohol dehydrogenase family)
MLPTGRFDGKALVVTGGGSGIGAATARQFAAEGGRVAVIDRDGARAREVAAGLAESIGLEADVASDDSLSTAIAQAAAHLGGIDHVLTSAGHAEFGPIEDWTLERWNAMLAVHVTGTFLACKHALPHLRARGGGSIVTVASVAAFVAEPTNAPTGAPKRDFPSNNAPYGAAKSAVVGLSRHLARDLAADGIRVNVVAPGSVRTGITIPLYTARGGGDYEKGERLSAATNPQNRIAEPEEIAAPICFLFSDEAGFVTGQVLIPDGGQTVT